MVRKTNNSENMKEVVYVSWEESERGWGTRPDGCTLHLTKEDYVNYVKDYNSRLPNYVPDEYERPAGIPIRAYTKNSLFEKIRESENGLRLYGNSENKLRNIGDLVLGNERSGWMTLE